ncbi:MAG TPA: cytochrome c biogenesis protein ResB [Opitutaceae bacterium]|nr:cytochrome c biogenesis protein ResB [Opitutaceae bacterium]
MKNFLTSLRDFFVSLKLTVVLLVFGMLLVFAATLDQVNLGVWAVQAKYFRSFIIYSHVGSVSFPVFPGGYVVGGLLLINLVAAHLYRFSLSWRKAGIFLAHFGLILLLVGELLSGLWQKDFHLRLAEGESKNYAESFRDNELVVIDTTDAKFDDVVAIPENVLARKTSIQHPKLPFRLVTKTYYPNSLLQRRTPAMSAVPEQATAGFGTDIVAAPQPLTYKEDERNLPTALIEIAAPDQSLGTWLVSTQLVMPQEFDYAGRHWQISLRVKRAYQPFTLTLVKFSHDVYAGTDIPKNFSSRLRLTTPDGREDREVLIYMNNPLRYAGLTFYQAGFENNDRTTILQVVRNPSWLMPYVACGLMTAGLLLQFGIHLGGFVAKRRAKATASQPAAATGARPATT